MSGSAATAVANAMALTGSVWVPQSALKFVPSPADKDIVLYNGFVTIRKAAMMETELAENMMRILKCAHQITIDATLIDSYIDEFEEKKNEGRKLHIHQRDAVHMVVNQPFSIFTGGPGTGKTTTLSAIAYVLRKIFPLYRIVYTAPTGKAARRIAESTGENATTLHKKLGLGYGNRPERFFEEVIFIDESSMADLELASTLFQALMVGQKVVLVGDVDQLPSVGIGAVLRDAIASGCIPCTMLTKTFRQDNSSTLFENIQNFREGTLNLIEGSDFKPIRLAPETGMNDIAITLRETYLQAVEKYGLENVVMLIPYRRYNTSVISADFMSSFIQGKINPEKTGYAHEKENHTRFFKKGDYVMQLENRKECANGEVGIVTDVTPSGVLCEFNGESVFYEGKNLEQLALAYAMSIHKSQGSEYPCVIMCLLNKHKTMLNRNLLYTGVTRAKKECILFYQDEAIETAVKTKADQERFSFLAEKLKMLDIQYRVSA